MNKLLVSFLLILLASTSFAEPVWIDVRTPVEHFADNIDGDVRITHTEIVTEIASLYPDKKTPIHLYCAKGGRASKALSALEAAGYSNVANAGGIADAREARGLRGD